MKPMGGRTWKYWPVQALFFSLTGVCVCVCLSVCAKKFVSGYLTKELTDLDENYGVRMLQLALNREPPLTSTIGPLFPPNLGRRVIFAIL